MSNQQIAEKVYHKFSNVSGNQHIASLYALRLILDLIQENRSASILEVGLGIGSISNAILNFAAQNNKHYHYDGTEANEFCLGQLHVNLGPLMQKITVYPGIDALPRTTKYDLMIIDGSDASLENLKELVTENAVIFIEGDRTPQEGKIRKLFPRHLFCQMISTFKNPEHGPFSSEHWSSGGKIIYINPTAGQKIRWFWQKARTALLYKRRALLK